jgi:hypothetical protein
MSTLSSAQLQPVVWEEQISFSLTITTHGMMRLFILYFTSMAELPIVPERK